MSLVCGDVTPASVFRLSDGAQVIVRKLAEETLYSEVSALKCKICSLLFESLSEFENHHKKNHELESGGVALKVNEKSAQDRDLIYSLLALSEKEEDSIKEEYQNQKNKTTKCHLCHLYFYESISLDLHLKCHISNSTKLLCYICQQTFDKWKLCVSHLSKVHSVDIDLFVCPICKTFKTINQSSLNSHIKIHSDLKTYQCTDCSKSFKQASQLKNHKVTHMNKDNTQIPKWYSRKICDICNKTFSDSKCLKKHVQAVHSKLKPYRCHVCSHTSSRKAMLDLHMRQHTGEKPYSCDLCSYKTGDHNSLRRHKTRHTGIKPYRCSECEYSTTQQVALKKHFNSKHEKSSIEVEEEKEVIIRLNEDDSVSSLTYENSSSNIEIHSV